MSDKAYQTSEGRTAGAAGIASRTINASIEQVDNGYIVTTRTCLGDPKSIHTHEEQVLVAPTVGALLDVLNNIYAART